MNFRVLTFAIMAAALVVPTSDPVSAAVKSSAVKSTAAESPAVQELVRNGGFDTGATSWTLSSGVSVGAGAVSVTSTGTAWAGATSASFGLDARRVTSVRVSAKVKLEGVVQGQTADNTAKISIAFVDAGGKRTWKGVNLTGDLDWTTRADSYPVPAGTVSAQVALALDRATGTARFDDISVSAETWANLVPNPSFELATPSTPACPAPSWCTPYLSSAYGIDSGVAAQGSRSMRIDGSPTAKIGGFVNVPLEQRLWPTVHVSAKVRLADIRLADYTAFPGAARISMSFLYVNEQGATVYTGSGLLGGILTGTKDWTTVSGSFRVPALSTRLQLIPTVQTSTGTMWVDDIRVTPESPWVSPDAQTKTALTGGAASFRVTVTNQRSVADTLKLGVSDTSSVEPVVTRELKPGESTVVTVTVAAGQSTVLTVAPSGDATLVQTATYTAATSAAGAAAPPRVYNTPAQLENLRKRIAEQQWASSAFTSVVRTEADAWLSRPLDKPVDHGGWSGNFKCPGTNTMLEFDYTKPDSHRCPLDGKIYSGQPYATAWIEIWHNNAAQAAADLGLAYQLVPGSDPARSGYAAKARDILVYYADRFTSVPLNSLYGRIHYQSLDEAVAAIGLIDGYDLVREALSPADRVNIEENLLRPLADMLVATPMATSNFQAWTAAAVYGVGSAIDDESLRDWALDDPEDGAGFLLDKAVVDDGWWWEGSSSYHLYALQPLTQMNIAARNRGRDFIHDPRFRAMHTTLLPYLYPDMTVPAAGDGGTWGRKYGPNFTAFAEWAYAEYGDPDFAAGLALAYNNMGRPRNDRWALRHGADSIPQSIGSRQASTTFTGLGETVLRSGEAANLVPNPGFEEASIGSAAVPSFWNLNGATWDAKDKFSGKRALSVAGKQSAEQRVPLDGRRHTRLALSAMMRGTGHIEATFLSSNGHAIGGEKLTAAAGWSSREVRLDVPRSAAAIQLTVRGGVTVDDLDLWVDDLVANGGFESGAQGWRASGRADVFPFGYRGSSSARVSGAGEWTLDVPVTGGNIMSVELTARALAVVLPIKPNGGARIELSFVTSAGTVTAPVRSDVRELLWRQRSVRADVPKDAVAARISLVVADAIGLALFDDVSLAFTSAVDPFQANAIRLDHGIPGGVHGHADKLHLDIVGGGGLQSTDLGQVYGSDNRDLTENWYRESVSHNTVVVDGRSQDRNARGSLRFFGTTDRLQVVDATGGKAYGDDVSLRRAGLMTDEYTLDVFDATGSAPHRYDQSWHGMGELKIAGPKMGPPSCGTDCVLDPNDKDFGYHRLRAVAEGQAEDGHWNAQWATKSSVLSLWSLEPVPTTVLQTTGPGLATTGEQMPFVLARREGMNSARFTTLIETRSAAEPTAVRGAKRMADGHVRVDLANGRQDDLLFDQSGGYAMVQQSRDRPTGIDLLNRSSVTVDGRELVKVTDGSAPKTLANAAVRYDGSVLRVSVHRNADRASGGTVTNAGQVVMTVYAPGIRTVELNNQPLGSITRNGDMITVRFQVT